MRKLTTRSGVKQFVADYLPFLPLGFFFAALVLLTSEFILRPNLLIDYLGVYPMLLAFLPLGFFLYQAWAKRCYFSFPTWFGWLTLILALVTGGFYLVGYVLEEIIFYPNYIFATSGLNYHALGSISWLSLVYFGLSLGSIKNWWQKKWLLICFFVFCFSFLLLALIEFFNLGDLWSGQQLNQLYIFWNVVFIALLVAVTLALTNRLIWSWVLLAVPLLFLALVDYYKIVNRNQPLFPSDFLLGEELQVLNHHYLSWPKLAHSALEFWLTILLLAFLIFVAARTCAVIKLAFRRRLQLGLVALSLLVGMLWWWQSSWAKEISQIIWNYDYNQSYLEQGLLYSLFRNQFLSKAQPPATTYTQAQYQDLLAQCATSSSFLADSSMEVNQATSSPNIIAIMNESFYDFAVTGDPLNTQEFMPYYQLFRQEGLSGYLKSAAYGGGTAQAEFAFLTGHNPELLSSAKSPYVYYVLRKIFSLNTILKERGYQTLAYHPYNGHGYNRYLAYPLIGFEHFYSEEAEFRDYQLEALADLNAMIPAQSESFYVSDSKAVTVMLEDNFKPAPNNEPLFQFLVTMQGHGPYYHTLQNTDQELTQINQLLAPYDLDDEETLVMSNIASNLMGAERSLEILYRYLRAPDAPDTIVVFFGDHQPGLRSISSIYTKLGLETDEGPHSDYLIPYFIWSNYQTGTEFEERLAAIDLPRQNTHHLALTLEYLLTGKIPAYWQVVVCSEHLGKPEMQYAALYDLLFANNQVFNLTGNFRNANVP
jgi:phosphoglycerol transferase MdoB-like AlkP superfamily enzyme